jgi:fatty acid desaturase
MVGDTLRPTNRTFDVQKQQHETWVKLGVLAALAVISPTFIPGYLLMLYGAWTLNWLLSYCEHHKAADPTDERRDSVSCYNRVYNALLFNTGYHQEHHYRPGVHWTKLPEVRKQLPVDRVVTQYTLFDNGLFAR